MGFRNRHTKQQMSAIAWSGGRRALLGGLLVIVSAATTIAADWPNKPIRAIIPLGAGSTVDIIPRAIFDQLSQQLGQPIVIENRPGAGGTIATAMAAKAEPDGYTIIVHSSTHTIAPSVVSNITYDPAEDFAGVTTLANVPNVLVAAPSKNFRTIQDFIAAAKAKPGSINYASGGVGTPPHLNMERFRLKAGFEAQHIPFKSAPETLAATIAGTTDIYFAPIPPTIQLIRDGKLVGLAVGGLKRFPGLADVPTLTEAGYANADSDFWIGVLVPKKTPRDIVNKLHHEILKALQTSTVQANLARMSVEVRTMDPMKFDAFIKEELQSNDALAKAVGLRAQ